MTSGAGSSRAPGEDGGCIPQERTRGLLPHRREQRGLPRGAASRATGSTAKSVPGTPTSGTQSGGEDAGSALGKPCSLPAPAPGRRCKNAGGAAPSCPAQPPAVLWEAVVSPRVRVSRLWFLRFVSSSDARPQLGLCSPPLPACSPYPVSIMQHEITALLDFQLPFGMRGNSSAGLVGGPGYPETQKESDLLEEN